MPTKLDPGSDRTKACWLAFEHLRRQDLKPDDPPRSVNATAKEFGLTQQTLNKFHNTKELGIDFADQIASKFDTTVDGLVWLFLRGGDQVRAGDVPGWEKAVEECRALGWDYPYELAQETRLPVAPSYATPAFARDLALFIQNYGRTSHTRIQAVRVARTDG